LFKRIVKRLSSLPVIVTITITVWQIRLSVKVLRIPA
jgi:hypothetical protein